MKKQKLLSVLALILAMIFLGSVVSCDSSGNSDETSSSETTTGFDDESTRDLSGFTDPSAAAHTVPIAEGSTMNFKILRPEEATQTFYDFLLSFCDDLNALTGLEVEHTSDILYWNQEEDTDAYEILFGNCDRSTTDEVEASLGLNDWAIRAIGNKIVIFGHTKDTLEAAAVYFLENLLEVSENENGEVVLSYIGDYTYESGEKMFFTPDNPLSAYTVVYAEGDRAAATCADKFVKQIRYNCNIELLSVSDAESETECEILFGTTNRSASQNVDLSSFGSTGFSYRAVGKKLVFSAASDSAFIYGLQFFIATHMKADCYSNSFNLKTDTEESESAYLRIMSWNILTELWGDKISVESRDSLFVSTVQRYMPDVIGLQEVSDKWYSRIGASALSDTYEFVVRKNTYNSKTYTAYTSIMYNTKTMRLINLGLTNFTNGNSRNMRYVVWGLFERISDGERFIVTSTHWDLTFDRQIVDANQMAETVNSLYEQYSVPILCTGDYNVKESTAQYALFLEKTGFVDSRYNANLIGNEGKTYISPPLGVIPGSGEAIDHILCSPDTELLYYTIVLDTDALNTSDHCPIYVDVKLSSVSE